MNKTFFRGYRRGNDEFLIMEYERREGWDLTVGPVARFDTPDGDPAGLARAEAYLAFLNEQAGKWPYGGEDK